MCFKLILLFWFDATWNYIHLKDILVYNECILVVLGIDWIMKSACFIPQWSLMGIVEDYPLPERPDHQHFDLNMEAEGQIHPPENLQW